MFFLSMNCILGYEYFYPQNAKKILLINSYHHTLPWSLNLEEGIKRYLYNNKFDLYIEYLDARRNQLDSTQEKYFVEKLKHLYDSTVFDLILITDDHALSFFHTNYDSLYFLQNSPIIASGISDKELIQQVKHRNIFIFQENLDHHTLLHEIIHLFPLTDQLFVITQNDPVGDAFKSEFSRHIHQFADQYSSIQFIFNSPGEIEQMVSQISTLSENSVILVYDYGGTPSQHYYPIEEVLTSIRKNSDLPVFCLIRDWVSENMLGGYVVDAEEQGLLLGKEAIKHFENEQLFTPGIDSTSITQTWMFNSKMLKEYDIHKRKLPAHAIIIDEEDKIVRLLIFISLALSLLVIIIYFINRALKHKIVVSTQYLSDEVKKFEFFVSEMPIGYIALDESYTILNWNKSAEDIFKYSNQEMVGKNFFEQLNLQHIDSKRIDKNEKSSVRYLDNRTKNKWGDEIRCEWYHTNYKSTSGNTLFFILVIDITEKAKLQENLEILLEKAKEMMVQNDRYMASNMHDIKNLILPIVTYSEMMLTDNLPPEKMKKMAEKLHENAENLVETSTNLLRINKVRGNLTNIEPEHFNIYLKIQDIMITLDLTLTGKKILFRNTVDPHQEVFADPEMTNSILINLINNAIKFTPESGTILVTSEKTDDKYVKINIKDSGIGINESQIEQIFTQQKYFTREGTSGEKGTGVGLVLTKDLIEKNGGTLYFKNNTDGDGSTFSFTLPQ